MKPVAMVQEGMYERLLYIILKMKENSMSYCNNCESCAGGTDLPPGSKCEVCGNHNEIIGYRKLEYPMTKDDEDRDVPITSINN